VNNRISTAFITHAVNILVDVLTKKQIVSITTSHALVAQIEIPYDSFSGGLSMTAHTVLSENLIAFSDEYRFKIIYEMCESVNFFSPHKKKIDELRARLLNSYGELFPNPIMDDFDIAIVEETKHWLKPFPESLKSYEEALKMRLNGEYTRNCLDNLRFSLELLLKKVLSNEKSLEHQSLEVKICIKANGGSPQLKNMFAQVLHYYCKY
jgi:hypothetical protein